MLGGDGRAFDQRQEIALHAFAADIAAATVFAARADLVDLVDEDDAALLDHVDGIADNGVVVEQLVGFFRHQRIARGRDRDAPPFRLAAERLAQHVGEIDHTDLRAGHAGNLEQRLAAARLAHFDLDFLVVEFAGAQPFAEAFACRAVGAAAGQPIDDTILGAVFGLRLHVSAAAFAQLRDADVHQIAHDLLHVAADITHFRELRRFDFQERRLRKFGETARNLRLADAGRPDHEDVLRQNFFAQFRAQLLTPPAIAQGDGDGAFRIALTHDEAVEFGNDFARREATHAMLSMMMFSLV